MLGDRLVAAAVQRRRVETFVVDAEAPAAALRAELDQRRLTARAVSVGLPRVAVTVKPIDLPTVDGEVHEMVRFELERHLPFAGEDTPFDFVPLTGDGDGAGRRVLIVAADRRLVESTLRVAEEAKLRPVSLTVAAHNLPALVARQRQGRIVWVHRAGSAVDLLFLDAGALVFSRGVADADDEQVADEIRRSFAVTHWRGCDAIWVSGDITPESVEPLHALGAPVGHPPYTVTARRLLEAADDGPRGLVELALAVAVAPRARALELLPRALRPRRLTQAQLLTAGLSALCAGLVVVALLVPGWREGRRLAAVNARIAALDPEVREVEKVMQELDRKRRMLAVIHSIEFASMRPLPVLRDLTELLPDDAWLTMLSLDDKGVQLMGQAGAAAALIPLLENSSRLERVEFSSPVTRGRDREQFHIKAAWEGGSPNAALTAVRAPAGPAAAPPPVPGQAAGRPAGPRPGSVGPPTPPRPMSPLPPPVVPGPPAVHSAPMPPSEPPPQQPLPRRPPGGSS